MLSKQCQILMLICTPLVWLSNSVYADQVSLKATQHRSVSWQGNVALRNNYVFSTGTEIDDKPVAQLWVRGSLDNGLFVDVWANAPLNSGNPRRSAEIDYSIGYIKDLGAAGSLTAMLSYFDIQNPDLFSYEGDVLSPVLRWQKGSFYIETMGFLADGDRNGFRVVNSYTHRLNEHFSLRGNLNYANGPFTRQDAIIGKLSLNYRNPKWWIEGVSIEHSDILHAGDEFDPRGSATTFSLIKDLF